MKQYKVGPSRSTILGRPPKLYKPGEEVPAPRDEKEQGRYDGLVNSGLLECYDPDAPNVPEDVVVPPSAPPEDDLRNGAGKWNYNPDRIKRWGLKRLNETIVNDDPFIEPFEDKAEAVEFLSLDFEPFE